MNQPHPHNYLFSIIFLCCALALKHKLMTLRDDAIFLGFLLQCYLYRVDKSRCNEFGYAYEVDTASCCVGCKSDAEVPQRSDEHD